MGTGAGGIAEDYGTTAELMRRLGSALAFARRTVEGADPAHPLWKVDLGQVSGYEKMMMEVGLLAHLVSRAHCCDDEARDLARTIRAHYDATSALTCILRHPRLATSLGTLLLVLDGFGLATEQERAVVRSALRSPYLHCSEHVPFRLLDRHWTLGLAEPGTAPLTDALRLSAACRITHPIYMTREDGYAITHAVMYATDFGARAVPAELRGEAVWQSIDAAVAWCTASGDFDLLVELLLAQLLLRRRFSAYGAVAWQQCRVRWDALGFLPSPSLRPDAFNAISDEAEQRQYALQNMYHTVLVGGLLCLALLGLDVAAPDRTVEHARYTPPDSVAAAVDGALRHLEQTLHLDRAGAQEVIAGVSWTADATGIDRLARTWSERPDAVIEQMAIDSSIILAAQDYDLAELAAALRRAALAGSATPTVHAGADFLARQSLPSGAIGAGWLAGSAGDAIASARCTAALANCLLELGAPHSREASVA